MVELDRTEFTIVGVVRDVPPVRPGEAVPPQIFWSNRQMPRLATYFLVRTATDPAMTAAAVEARIAATDPDLQVSRTRTLRDWLARELVRPRFAAVLVGTFGVFALVLAAVGTFALLAYAVAQRTREIGVRLAIGARPTTIVRDVLAHGMRLATLGAAVGLAGALALTRLLEGQLAGVTSTDVPTYALSIALLLAAAALACVVPAWRASRVSPTIAMQAE
jgi:putative ABC transport system permease protein